MNGDLVIIKEYPREKWVMRTKHLKIIQQEEKTMVFFNEKNQYFFRKIWIQ